jgi:hypothetical protein
MPFYQLTHYCRSNTAVGIARILKDLLCSAEVNYKFGIQVPNGIKNAIDLDKKNGNQLWQVAIRTELKQLQGRIFRQAIKKIPNHIVFDVKLDLRHKARLVIGGNGTVNDKEDIYSGVVRMDTVRIGFFLWEL